MAARSTTTDRQHRKGATTHATDPRAYAEAADSCSVHRNAVASATQKTEQPLVKILVCDDDQADRELLYTCLQQIIDREVVLLQPGRIDDIQYALDKRRIDLVLIDSRMPPKPGMEWLAEVTRKQLAPVIMLTGSAIGEVTTQALHEGSLGYLPKGNLSADKLNNAVNLALDKWNRLQQAKADREKLERLATYDSLTGLYNRQAILAKLRESVNLANRYREDFSLTMLDIDHFRKINDRYGHLTGDDVLERAAALIRGNIRDADTAGRYGGEEFMIILPRVNLSSSWVAAERLRAIIEKTRLKDFAENVFSITVSQGLVAWERNDNVASLISRAEEALHKAKQKGRNRVQILLGPSLRDKV
jgi:diguanylate cyclase (GGDEF)-like protein